MATVYITENRADSDRIQRMLLDDGAHWSDGRKEPYDYDLIAIFRNGNSLSYLLRDSATNPYIYITKSDIVILSSKARKALKFIKQLKDN